MQSICFQKRGAGNSLSKPVGIIAGIVGIGILFKGVNWMGFIIVFSYLFCCIIYLFAKEMIEIDMENNLINNYYQILFFKTKKKKSIIDVEYFLVRDFSSSINYASLSNVDSSYEVSAISENQERIVIAYREGRKQIITLIKNLEESLGIHTKDKTRSKILDKEQADKLK